MTWPVELIAVRHGESVANAAFAAARDSGRERVEVNGPDWAIPLSRLGREQSTRLGEHLAGTLDRIDAVFTSSYLRARETASLALGELCRLTNHAPPIGTDERLRDRELGLLELMTPAMIECDLPAEACRRRQIGEFSYRPPEGESFPDVITRVRDFVADLRQSHQGKRVLVIAHDAVVLMLRYVLEGLTPEMVMAAEPVRNTSVTRWVAARRGIRLVEFNTVPASSATNVASYDGKSGLETDRLRPRNSAMTRPSARRTVTS